MRIGFDAKKLFTNFTGLGNYSRFVVEALRRSFPEYEYLLFTPRVKINSDTQFVQASTSIQTIAPPAYFSKLKLGGLWRSFLSTNSIRDEKISLYHGLSHELPFNMEDNIKKVVTVHDLIFLRYPQFYKPIDIAIYKTKVKYACSQADKIVAISKQTADDVEHFLKIDRSKIDVVYQGCHSNFEKTYSDLQLDDIRQKYNLPQHFILNVGTIEPRKNALLIVKALNRIKRSSDVSVVIMGRSTAYVEEIKRYAIEHGLTDRVKLLHNVLFEDFPAIYKLAKVFVYPSLFEGFGIPLVEALRCGTPVISSVGSCFSEAAGPSTIYIDPNDDLELANQLDRVLQKTELRNEMITKGSEFVKRFEPHYIAEDMMSVYKSIL